MPGAWAGIWVAAFMLMEAGWRSTLIAGPLWIEPMGADKVHSKANRKGLRSIEDHPRPGRPSQFDEKALRSSPPQMIDPTPDLCPT